jgi:hypothetical protein
MTLRTDDGPSDGSCIRHARVIAALAASDAPVRFLTGPLGSGKSAALQAYAESTGVPLISIEPGGTADDLAASLRSVRTAREVAIDGADTLAPDALERLTAVLEDAHAQRRYLIAGRSRRLLRVQRLVALGIADWFDAELTVLTRDDVRALAVELGIEPNDTDIDQLHYDTDGWPIAVRWVLRYAGRNGRTLRGAFDGWCRSEGQLLRELVSDAVGEAADAVDAGAYERLLAGKAVSGTDALLERLDACGMPVVRARTGRRPYRVLLRLGEQPGDAPADGEGAGALVIKLFGQFSCEIDGRRLIFARRRDQNVLAYVALAAGAAVSRAELMRVFWPDAGAAVASQGLRTSLCRLRRTIAQAAGIEAEAYLTINHTIALNLRRVTIDTRRFVERVELARREEERGNLARAREHCSIAERLYAGDLLASEAVEPPLHRHVAELAQTFDTILTRLVDLHIAHGDPIAAERIACRSLSLGRLEAQPA